MKPKESVKYLGLHIDRNLTYQQAVKIISKNGLWNQNNLLLLTAKRKTFGSEFAGN